MQYYDFDYVRYHKPEQFTYTATEAVLTEPRNVRVHPGITGVSATWNSVSGASEYHVTVDGNTHKAHATHVNIPVGLAPGKEYTIKVTAVHGDKSGPPHVTTFRTLPALSPPPSSPPTNKCKDCKDHDDCTACKGAPLCIGGECHVCDPRLRVSTDSECHKHKHVCAIRGGEPKCTTCLSDPECISSYGPRYTCHEGRCVEPHKPEPSPEPTTNVGMIIGVSLAVLMFLIVIVMMVYLLGGGGDTATMPDELYYPY